MFILKPNALMLSDTCTINQPIKLQSDVSLNNIIDSWCRIYTQKQIKVSAWSLLSVILS